ncbi:MAG TPA: Lrp/AsnC ligand binding domain-containing protein [Candidatus Thermoplasmatota archaeon]|nr:Lrp/AsnC ligand binding domain-containing protein [Candidatus Thermoplasmatota archaeon]
MSASDVEKDLSQYYAQRNVEAVILLKVDTARADDIALALAKFSEIEHAYLVTGEDDIILKARFRSYRELKDFIIKSIGPLDGVEDTKTMMVVTTYKESGKVVE